MINADTIGMGTCIIICAGEAKRWGNYLGIPKHLISIDGETLLERTVRLFSAPGRTVHIVGLDERFRVPGAELYVPTLNPHNMDADKCLSSESLWNHHGRTIVLWGDVYFSDEAAATITDRFDNRWQLFARPWPSEVTGKPWGEPFGQSFYPQHIDEHRQALHRIAQLHREGRITRSGGWEHYRAMLGLTDEQIGEPAGVLPPEQLGRLVVVDDWTEDFDRPQEYDIFMARRSAAGLAGLIPAQCAVPAEVC